MQSALPPKSNHNRAPAPTAGEKPRVAFVEYTPELIETVTLWSGKLGPPDRRNRSLEGIRVFASNFRERYLAKAHPASPGVWFLPVVGLGIYRIAEVGWLVGTAVFLAGILIWSLLEYVLHRFLFHRAPNATFNSKLLAFMLHGYHHEFPNDRWRLVAPPLLSFPHALVVGGAYWLLFDQYWLVLFAGTTSGYLAYDWIHYYTHHFSPRSRLGKFLRRYHLEHHFKDGTAHFGITSPLWDIVFGTYVCRPRPVAEGSSTSATPQASQNEPEPSRTHLPGLP